MLQAGDRKISSPWPIIEPTNIAGALSMAYIVIADDDELIAELASQVLIDAGHACGWVTSGEDCWALLKGRRPDVLLLDQNMPGISGVSLLRRLRQSEAYYDLPVIMFTAMTGAEDETQAIYAGAQDFIRKPFDPRGFKRQRHQLFVSIAFNIGQTSENYQIRDIAMLVKDVVPGSTLGFADGASPDVRNYRVDCNYIATKLHGWKPQWTVRRGIEELYDAYKTHGVTLEEFEGEKFKRIAHIRQRIEAGELSEELFELQTEAVA